MPVVFGIMAAILFAQYYLFTPQLSLDTPGMYMVLMLTAGIGAALGRMVNEASHEYPRGRRYGQEATKFVPSVAPTWLTLFAVAMLVIVLVGAFLSSGILRAGSYQRLLGQPVEKEFDASLPPLELQNAPLVSYDMAIRAAEKELANIPALGSQTEVGTMHKQLVDGKLYWVGFLEHRGFFKWWERGSTPGYVRVSATDPSDVKLVTEVEGKKLRLQYLDSAFFGSNAERFLRFNGYATQGLSDLTPEIDDKGRPYLVGSVFERRVGFSGRDATGVVVLDVQTGEREYFSTAKAPAWVDRVQPETFVKEQVGDFLEYVHGWFNPSHTDMLSISGEVDLIYGSDGRAYYFAGLGSTAREGGLIGFMLIDSRTKEVSRYTLPSVTEDVARRAAEGVYPEKQYSATNALPFMVEGQPAYVMALRDRTGIPRSYALVDIRDYQKVAVADTLDAAVRLFHNRQNLDRTATGAQPRADEVVFQAKVLRAAAEVRAGTSNYVFVLDGHGGQLYTADVNRSDDISVTQAGDMVEVRTLQTPQRVQPILQFKNLTLQAQAPKAAKAASAPAP